MGKPTLLAGQFGDYLQSFQTIKKEKDRMSFCCLGRLFQPHSMLKRLKQNNLKEFCSFHTTVFPLHSEWMKQQGQAVKMQGNRQAEMIARREKRKQEEHEEVMRNALREREKAMPKDKLDEDYFKDYSRFNKEKDERDPLFHGIKDKGAEDWGSLLREGVKNSREKFSKIKESEPLTFNQVNMEGTKFGYKTYSFGGRYGGALMMIFIILFSSELWYQYQENVEEKKLLDIAMKRGQN